MVLGTLELKVGVAQLALLGAEVFKVLGAVVGVAELVLVVYPRAVLAAVGRSEGGGTSDTCATLHHDSVKKAFPKGPGVTSPHIPTRTTQIY